MSGRMSANHSARSTQRQALCVCWSATVRFRPTSAEQRSGPARRTAGIGEHRGPRGSHAALERSVASSQAASILSLIQLDSDRRWGRLRRSLPAMKWPPAVISGRSRLHDLSKRCSSPNREVTVDVIMMHWPPRPLSGLLMFEIIEFQGRTSGISDAYLPKQVGFI